MLARASQLAQNRPSGTTAVSAFTASVLTEVTKIIVCNTTALNREFSIYHDDDGATFDDTTALYRSVVVEANNTYVIELMDDGAGISVSGPEQGPAAGQIGVQTNLANSLTFTLYGMTADVAGDII